MKWWCTRPLCWDTTQATQTWSDDVLDHFVETQHKQPKHEVMMYYTTLLRDNTSNPNMKWWCTRPLCWDTTQATQTWSDDVLDHFVERQHKQPKHEVMMYYTTLLRHNTSNPNMKWWCTRPLCWDTTQATQTWSDDVLHHFAELDLYSVNSLEKEKKQQIPI
jgi:hypothetical protein